MSNLNRPFWEVVSRVGLKDPSGRLLQVPVWTSSSDVHPTELRTQSLTRPDLELRHLFGLITLVPIDGPLTQTSQPRHRLRHYQLGRDLRWLQLNLEPKRPRTQTPLVRPWTLPGPWLVSDHGTYYPRPDLDFRHQRPDVGPRSDCGPRNRRDPDKISDLYWPKV